RRTITDYFSQHENKLSVSGFEENGGGDSCDNFTDLNLSHCFLGTSLYVRLLLYTRANPACGRELHHQRFPSEPLFNLSRPTAFVIHGYRPTGAPPVWIDHLVRLLAERRDVNVIVVDWNRGAANLNYLTAVAYTREAAHNLTGFIRSMQEEGASLDSMHLIGVSLGAHLAGFVGANLKGKIGRITGLDPAGPLFTSATPDERLDPSDAMFVDVLHTDMDSFGLRGAHGHIDFYANGGADQPGCPKTIFAGKSYFVCDHQRSMFLYLCALNGTCSLTAYPCASYADFLDGRCLQCEAFKPASCPQLGYDVIQWRESLLKLGQTKAFFSTTASHPYTKLNYRVDMVTWNQYLRWGVVYIRLHSVKPAHKTHHLPHVHKISLRINTGNVIGPRYKIRLLRIRLTPLERPQRPLMCRFDIFMEENTEVAFRPLSCDSRL
uniref:Lipase member H-like n=1 Tax=Hippocampus comes TaxID=109280 RepID=A0A3Q3D8S5_HIPCM